MLQQFSMTPMYQKHCLLYMTNVLSYKQTKPKNIIFVCEMYYIHFLSSEVEAENNSSNTIYKDEVVENHKSVLSVVFLPMTVIVIYYLLTWFLNS